MLKSSRVKRALYRSGALDALHRRRNRDRLTVIGFHRVLPRSDPRFLTSDPEYTLPLDVFAACLGFFERHYRVVSLVDVMQARRGARRLPARPLLITFDDGWRDNVEYALPLLRAARMPAAMFVAGAALDRDEPFWQEQLIAAWRSRRPADSLEPVRAMIAGLEALAPEERQRLLDTAADVLVPQPRSMISSDELRTLAAAGFAIGAHGFSHAPLTRVDASAELAATRALLQARLAPASDVPALAFPHGKFNARTVAHAHQLGFELLFTSVRELASATALGPGLIGRCGFTAASITDERGEFRPDLLALQLFRTPTASS